MSGILWITSNIYTEDHTKKEKDGYSTSTNRTINHLNQALSHSHKHTHSTAKSRGSFRFFFKVVLPHVSQLSLSKVLKKEDTNNMVSHCHKQIKKQIPTLLHLHLHCPTALKRRPTPDNQRQIVRTQLGLGVGRVRIGVASTEQDRVALDTRVKALFAQGEAF